jgi:hypothetical protein
MTVRDPELVKEMAFTPAPDTLIGPGVTYWENWTGKNHFTRFKEEVLRERHPLSERVIVAIRNVLG